MPLVVPLFELPGFGISRLLARLTTLLVGVAKPATCQFSVKQPGKRRCAVPSAPPGWHSM